MTKNTPSPGRILQASGGYWQGFALHAAVKLDVFSMIGDKPATARAVAEKIDARPRAVETLLNAMTAMDLLTKSGDEFANTDMSAAFLVSSSPRYLGHIIGHHAGLAESWMRMDETVMSGKPVAERASREGGESRKNFLLGMFNLAMGLAPHISEKVDLSGRKRLLDLGGGPGTYAVFFCKANPNLSAAVADLPTSRPFAEKIIDRFQLSDRIDFIGLDFLKDPIPKGFDAVWMSHILHAEGPEDARRIIKKAAASLNPGGKLIIHDFILNEDKSGPLFPALFSLNMLVRTSGGRSYCEAEIRDMLASAGAGDIKRIPIDSPNDSSILCAGMP